MGPVTDRQRKFLSIAASEIDRVVDLLNHLLQVSHLEKGALKIVRQKVIPKAFVEECIAIIAPLAEPKKITFETSIETDVPEIDADPERLRQIMDNLLGNAIKFSPPDASVQISSGFSDASQSVWFAVTDQGPGIEASETEHIFDKYYRGASSRDEVGGVGLGLSISKLIVEAHGGRLWLKSRVGRGSTFGFDLPLSKVLKVEA